LRKLERSSSLPPLTETPFELNVKRGLGSKFFFCLGLRKKEFIREKERRSIENCASGVQYSKETVC